MEMMSTKYKKSLNKAVEMIFKDKQRKRKVFSFLVKRRLIKKGIMPVVVPTKNQNRQKASLRRVRD